VDKVKHIAKLAKHLLIGAQYLSIASQQKAETECDACKDSRFIMANMCHLSLNLLTCRRTLKCKTMINITTTQSGMHWAVLFVTFFGSKRKESSCSTASIVASTLPSWSEISDRKCRPDTYFLDSCSRRDELGTMTRLQDLVQGSNFVANVYRSFSLSPKVNMNNLKLQDIFQIFHRPGKPPSSRKKIQDLPLYKYIHIF